MPRTRSSTPRPAGVLAAGALAALLSGCAGTPAPGPSPTPSATAAPIFASDEEALAAAEEAYARYLGVVDQLTQESTADAVILDGVVTPEYAVELHDSLERLRTSGNRTVGATKFDSMRLVERRESDDSAMVSVYVCLDVSGVQVIDAAGTDVTPADRVTRRPLRAQFESSPADPTDVLPSGSESWPGEDFC